LFAALAIPASLAAQDNRKPGNKDRHHHYKLIDLGTFGGPSSYFNSLHLTVVFGFGTVFYNLAQISSPQGVFVGFADTSTPDPYPAFCYTPDCFVAHAFQLHEGVETDLGVLPGGASSAAFWINADNWITGNSENGETDPLIPGLQRFGLYYGRTGRSKTWERLAGMRVSRRQSTIEDKLRDSR
jgi:hypothetical protein